MYIRNEQMPMYVKHYQVVVQKNSVHVIKHKFSSDSLQEGVEH